ncbi:MAG: ribbon-helix-helix protein, CopG family [Candidatus Electrothrix sp. MAN1_4]|nr:ribbon-helix-helix protein, CopG family [Candidatus Electrothrix sp. MAN1_4]
MHQIRWGDVLWQAEEIEEYELLKEKAAAGEKDMPEFIKEIIRNELKRIT